MGVQFGMKEGTPCQIAPPSVQRLGYRTPKLKILLRFDQNVEHKRPALAYPLREKCRLCTTFQNALDVKISLDLLKGYSGFKLSGSNYNQIFSGETVRQTSKSFRGARKCSWSSITMASLVGLGFHPPPGWPKSRVFCLSVCLSVRHAFERQSLRPISP